MKYQATIELNNPDKTIKITLEDEKEPYTFSFGRAYTLKGLLKRGTAQLQKGNGNQSRTSSLRASQQHDRLLHSPIHSLKGQAMKKTDGFVAILFIFGFVLSANEEMNFINIIGVACVFSALYIYRKGAKK